MAEEQSGQQPHQELIEDFIELSKGLAESSDMCDVVFPRENQEEIVALLTEEGSGIEAGKEPQKLTLQPIPMKLNPSAIAQATKCSLPVAPSTDQIYTLPTTQFTPAAQFTPEAPTTKATPSLLVLQNIRRIVASVQNFATTSKTQAAAYIAWHSGWFGCRFGLGAPEPRHFRAPLVLAASKGLRKWFGGRSTVSPTFCFNFSCLILFYRILFLFL